LKMGLSDTDTTIGMAPLALPEILLY